MAVFNALLFCLLLSLSAAVSQPVVCDEMDSGCVATEAQVMLQASTTKFTQSYPNELEEAAGDAIADEEQDEDPVKRKTVSLQTLASLSEEDQNDMEANHSFEETLGKSERALMSSSSALAKTYRFCTVSQDWSSNSLPGWTLNKNKMKWYIVQTGGIRALSSKKKMAYGCSYKCGHVSHYYASSRASAIVLACCTNPHNYAHNHPGYAVAQVAAHEAYSGIAKNGHYAVGMADKSQWSSWYGGKHVREAYAKACREVCGIHGLPNVNE